jgi:hypothetical protein
MLLPILAIIILVMLGPVVFPKQLMSDLGPFMPKNRHIIELFVKPCHNQA